MLKVYGIKNCGSVKKAFDFLESANIEYEFIDFKKNAPSIEQIAQWSEQIPLEILLNSKGTTYKKLGLKEQNLTKEQKIQTMSENPSLIKRPLLEISESKKVMCGFDEVKIKTFIKK